MAAKIEKIYETAAIIADMMKIIGMRARSRQGTKNPGTDWYRDFAGYTCSDFKCEVPSRIELLYMVLQTIA